MGRLTVRLPNVLHTQLEKIARYEGVSLNQYIVYALTRQASEELHQVNELAAGETHPAGEAHTAHPQAADNKPV
jgi:hypothetical protein